MSQHPLFAHATPKIDDLALAHFDMDPAMLIYSIVYVSGPLTATEIVAWAARHGCAVTANYVIAAMHAARGRGAARCAIGSDLRVRWAPVGPTPAIMAEQGRLKRRCPG